MMDETQAWMRWELAKHGVTPPDGIIDSVQWKGKGSRSYDIIVEIAGSTTVHERSMKDFPQCPA